MSDNSFYINRGPLLNLRREPSHRSELVSQMHYGEVYGIIQQQGEWYLVQSVVDGYEGWCTNTVAEKARSQFSPFPLSASLVKEIVSPGGLSLNVPAGSFLWSEKKKHPDHIISAPSRNFIQALAIQFMGSPYLWGGKTFMGIDCSGFTQIVLRLHGIFIKRDASQQVSEGVPVDFISEARAGDLAYFGNEEGNIVHTGIILGNGKIIHASGYVKIDNIDTNGIFNACDNKYTHFLRTIRRHF